MFVEDDVPFTSRTPTYLTPEQRHALGEIPADLSDREIARYYTFAQSDLDLINLRRRLHNRLGFAVQLAVLRFPGRPLKDVAGIPSRVLTAIADQVQAPASALLTMASLTRSSDQGTLVVWKLDRLGCSLQNLIATLNILKEPGVDFISLTENSDTTTPSGKRIFHVMSALETIPFTEYIGIGS